MTSEKLISNITQLKKDFEACTTEAQRITDKLREDGIAIEQKRSEFLKQKKKKLSQKEEDNFDREQQKDHDLKNKVLGQKDINKSVIVKMTEFRMAFKEIRSRI